MQTYTYEEAFQSSMNYFGGDELAARVWVNKYAMKDSFGNIYEKSPEDMHWRIANEIARIEKKYKNPLSAEDIFRLFLGVGIHAGIHICRPCCLSCHEKHLSFAIQYNRIDC